MRRTAPGRLAPYGELGATGGCSCRARVGGLRQCDEARRLDWHTPRRGQAWRSSGQSRRRNVRTGSVPVEADLSGTRTENARRTPVRVVDGGGKGDPRIPAKDRTHSTKREILDPALTRGLPAANPSASPSPKEYAVRRPSDSARV